MSAIVFKKGGVIFKQGDASDCMYDVLWGKVGIYANYGTPEEKLLTTLETEQFFGEMGMIEGLPRSATAVALKNDTKVRIITPETFQELFQKSPARVLMIIMNMSRRIRELTIDYLDACQTVAKSAEAEKAGAEISGELRTDLEKLSQIYQQFGNAHADN